MNFTLFKKDASHRFVRLMHVGFALLMAILYDVLFWDNRPGLGFLVFVAVYVVGFFVLTFISNKIHTKWPLLLLVPIVILSADVFIYNNDLVQLLTPWAVFGLLLLMSILLTLRNSSKASFFFFNIPVIRNIGISFRKWRHISRDVFVWKEGSEAARSRKIVQGILIALPILFIFGLLFSAADAVFADWIHKVFDFEITDITIWRFIRTIFLTMFVGGFLYVLISEEHMIVGAMRAVRKCDSTIMNVVLVLLNLFFALFVFIQIKYLFGGRQFVLGSALTFAEYARRGFFELFAVMLLAAAISLYAYYSYIHHAVGMGKKLLGGLHVLLLSQVAVVGFSVLKRMNLYQEEYGYTVLRLYVEWFIYLLFVLIMVGIVNTILQRSFRDYWYAILVTGLSAFVVVCSLNVDYRIGKENIQRAIARNDVQKLDVYYFHQLSADALPAFNLLHDKNFYNTLSAEQKMTVEAIVKRWNDTLQERYKDWREWNKEVVENLFRLP